MNELLLPVLLVPAVALVGRVLVRLPLGWARLAAWGALVVVVGLLATLPWEPIPRMVALCVGLLAAMKSLVYVEWAAGGRRLGWGSYCAFAFLWFGMDPGAFATVRPGIEFRSHFRIGLTCTLIGTLLALLVRSAGWTSLLVIFVPLSVAFHFGVLRLLTAGWRRFGYPVRTLFRNPLASRSLADFWGARWNLGYAHMMAKVVLRPAERLIGSRGAVLVVFLVSGLLHEMAITVPVGAGYGLPTLYFALQAVALEAERMPWLRRVRRLWAAGWIIAPIGLLFPPAFRAEVINPCLQSLPDLSSILPF